MRSAIHRTSPTGRRGMAKFGSRSENYALEIRADMEVIFEWARPNFG